MKTITVEQINLPVLPIKLNIEIGGFEPGGHAIYTTGDSNEIIPETYPPRDESFWTTYLNPRPNSFFKFDSYVVKRNPDNQFVSIWLEINDQLIEKPELEQRVDQNSLIVFKFTINFI